MHAKFKGVTVQEPITVSLGAAPIFSLSKLKIESVCHLPHYFLHRMGANFHNKNADKPMKLSGRIFINMIALPVSLIA